MIARIWTGATRTDDADYYQSYQQREAMPGYTEVHGNRGVLMLRRDRGDGHTEFTMITLWDDLISVMSFAGPDADKAVFYPEDEQLLTERELVVRHYDVYDSHGLLRV